MATKKEQQIAKLDELCAKKGVRYVRFTDDTIEVYQGDRRTLRGSIAGAIRSLESYPDA